MDLNQVTIPSKNVEKSVAFYQMMGLRLIVDSSPRYVRFECARGNTTLSVHHVDKLPSGEGTVLYFECLDLDQRVEQLAAAGILFDSMPEDKSWLWREAHLRDPDGNRLILFYAGENRKNPPWRI